MKRLMSVVLSAVVAVPLGCAAEKPGAKKNPQAQDQDGQGSETKASADSPSEGSDD